MEAITLVNNYKDLFNTPEKRQKNAELLKDLFSKAKQIQFNNLDFPESTANYQLHLGYDEIDLYGILIKSDKNVFFGDTITSKTIVSKFKNIEYIVPNNLNTRLENLKEITYDAVIARKNHLEAHLSQLIDESLKKNEMVEFFLLDNDNIKTGNNTSIFTSVIDSEKGGAIRFDLVTINSAYMDTVRPVPPFRPSW